MAVFLLLWKHFFSADTRPGVLYVIICSNLQACFTQIINIFNPTSWATYFGDYSLIQVVYLWSSPFHWHSFASLIPAPLLTICTSPDGPWDAMIPGYSPDGPALFIGYGLAASSPACSMEYNPWTMICNLEYTQTIWCILWILMIEHHY